MKKNSPMMEQYKAIKEEHPDKLLLFQVGDFYELFFEDARVAAREMEISLTTRDAGSEDPIPLAGVPIHAADTYLNKLLARGHRVVVCDQVEEASAARGLVRREITRILTPGTVTDPEMLEESRNNYLGILVQDGGEALGLAVVDISTGEFRITEQGGEGAFALIADELHRLQPAELLCWPAKLAEACRTLSDNSPGWLVDSFSSVPEPAEARKMIADYFPAGTWEEVGLKHYPMATRAAAAALTYLAMLRQLPGKGFTFQRLELYFTGRAMQVDSVSRANLELSKSLREGGRRGSLLGLLDRCQTSMGRRLLRRRLEEPLLDEKAIKDRLDAVEELQNKPLEARQLTRALEDIFDLERFTSRLTYERVDARDLVALKTTLIATEKVTRALEPFRASLLQEHRHRLPDFADLVTLLGDALADDPPAALKDGGLFRDGYDPELDQLRQAAGESGDMLLRFEKQERERTGIKSLRIGFNRNFGYYLEVTKANLEQVPPEYQRKQTLLNAERYTTAELNAIEEQVTGARERLARLEYQRFIELRRQVAGEGTRLLAASGELAAVDCALNLARIAVKMHYCRPHLAPGRQMAVRQARHPVVEQVVGDLYVANDIIMDEEHFILLITGPNMAGKSTYIRTAALLAIMAQAGSFVPATEAQLPLFDRLFARIGASDDLSRGQSTFMVEMEETALILREATPASLVILDEIGRGTSTYDGMSIARSVVEYLGKRIKAMTLFSTHYHELTDLENELPGVKNLNMAVKEKGREVIFLRRVLPGRADKSYGINVARLAGVPLEVLLRAEKILARLEQNAATAKSRQLSLLPLLRDPEPPDSKTQVVLEELREVNINTITPLEAQQTLFRLQQNLLQADDEGKNS